MPMQVHCGIRGGYQLPGGGCSCCLPSPTDLSVEAHEWGVAHRFRWAAPPHGAPKRSSSARMDLSM
jgi:hypothetical protein